MNRIINKFVDVIDYFVVIVALVNVFKVKCSSVKKIGMEKQELYNAVYHASEKIGLSDFGENGARPIIYEETTQPIKVKNKKIVQIAATVSGKYLLYHINYVLATLSRK